MAMTPVEFPVTTIFELAAEPAPMCPKNRLPQESSAPIKMLAHNCAARSDLAQFNNWRDIDGLDEHGRGTDHDEYND